MKKTTKHIPAHYYRLKEAREKFDEVLIEFIKEELTLGNELLASEAIKLREENAKLKERIAELEHPDFAKTLHNTLHTNSNNSVQRAIEDLR